MIYINSLVVFLGIVVMADAQMCYSPDGTAFPSDSPCHSPSIVDGASACCNTHDVCLNNGLCLSQAGGEFIYRGTCTDQSWQSPNCSQYCADGKSITQRLEIFFNGGFRCGLIMTLIST